MNRKQRRQKNKLRFTKPLRHVRKKWIIGLDNVTFAIRHGIGLHHFMRVISLGLKINDLAELGKELTDGKSRVGHTKS